MRFPTQYKINVISHNRPLNARRSFYSDIIDEITYYIGSGETREYSAAGAKHIVESGGLVESRNMALLQSFRSNKDCVIIEDDLKSLCVAQNKKKKKSGLTISDVAREMYNVIYRDLRGMVYLAGVAPTDNTFYYNPLKPVSTNQFIVGSFIYVRKGCDLWFDPQFKTKEDYDYTLQHIKKYGAVARLNYFLATFEHYGNKGGVVDWRNKQVEQDSITKLKRKWGKAVADNPRRPNEILLKVR